MDQDILPDFKNLYRNGRNFWFEVEAGDVVGVGAGDVVGDDVVKREAVPFSTLSSIAFY